VPRFLPAGISGCLLCLYLILSIRESRHRKDSGGAQCFSGFPSRTPFQTFLCGLCTLKDTYSMVTETWKLRLNWFHSFLYCLEDECVWLDQWFYHSIAQFPESQNGNNDIADLSLVWQSFWWEITSDFKMLLEFLKANIIHRQQLRRLTYNKKCPSWKALIFSEKKHFLE
jgi:hypothetical protein